MELNNYWAAIAQLKDAKFELRSIMNAVDDLDLEDRQRVAAVVASNTKAMDLAITALERAQADNRAKHGRTVPVLNMVCR